MPLRASQSQPHTLRYLFSVNVVPRSHASLSIRAGPTLCREQPNDSALKTVIEDLHELEGLQGTIEAMSAYREVRLLDTSVVGVRGLLRLLTCCSRCFTLFCFFFLSFAPPQRAEMARLHLVSQVRGLADDVEKERMKNESLRLTVDRLEQEKRLLKKELQIKVRPPGQKPAQACP